MALRYPSPTLALANGTAREARPRIIYNSQAVSLNTTDSLLDLSPRAATGRIRLLDCLAFLDLGALQIIEFPELPTIAYTIISYPWRGVLTEAVSEASCGHRFAVDGATDADPIGLIPLRHACIASLKRDCLYIWLDRLSITQTSQDDKNWHIQNMTSIYRSARLCIVLAGGAQRLARLNEETTWIHRSWTLVEALAPAEVVVLVEWKLGTGRGTAGTKFGGIQEVVPGESMVAPLVFLLHAGVVGHCSFFSEPTDPSRPVAPIGVQVSIFGAFPTGRASDGTPFWKLQHRMCAPSIMALIMAMDVAKGNVAESSSRAHAVWQSALMRTASRPVDMVYSVMGLFDVSLDPAVFAPDDLRGTSIALAQAILRTGQRATWLGATFRVEPRATLPTFPSKSAEGRAFVETKDGLREVDAVVRSPVRLYDTMPFQPPEAVMDDAGQLMFTAKAIQLRPVTEKYVSSVNSRTMDALDGSRWIAHCVFGEKRPSDGDSSTNEPRHSVYGVVIGWFDQDYSSMTQSFRNDTIRAMLLEEYAPGMFQLRTFFSLSWNERDEVEAWSEMEFCVTGGGSPPEVMSPHSNLPELETIPRDTICVVSLDAMKITQILSISETATPCRIRLVDCEALVEHGVLKIVEFPEFPTMPYSAISYPWLGVVIDSTVSGTAFSVEGAEYADPVGIDVLTHACMASLMRGCPYLWLDRLCIIQNNREDKNWQIQHMYQVYKSCRLCVVLAGGIRRLVRLDEPTPWIHRNWTLQEVLAPPEAVVLFAWKLGWGSTTSSGLAATIQEVVPNESAMATLSVILEACSGGTLAFTPTTLMTSPYGDDEVRVTVSLFSAHPSASAAKSGSGSGIFAPNVVALAIAMEPTLTTDSDTRAHAAWQSALMRTSSRPVDMVFSIMGLFGVTLDVGAFDKDDRRGATIALAQAILKGGGSASWLGAAARITPDRCLSTFPRFPRTSVAGAAMVRVGTGRRSRMQEVSQVVDHPVYPVPRAIGPLPKGRMDDAGYLTFTVRAVPLQATADLMKEDESDEESSTSLRIVEALDGSRWVLPPTSEGELSSGGGLGVYGALLGWFDKYFPGSSPAAGPDNIMVMVLEEHRTNVFHLRSFFHLGQKDRGTVLAWGERKFTVGGPDAPGSASPELLAPSIDDINIDQQDDNIPVISGLRKDLRDEIMEQVRRAIPQLVLERHREKALRECTDEYFVWTRPPQI